MARRWLLIPCLLATLALGGCCGASGPQAAVPARATTENAGKTSTPAVLPTAAGQPGLTLDGWRIAVVDSRAAADYRGALPAEGHKFQQLDLLVFNTGKVPRLATPGQWVLTAQWQGYSYEATGIDALQALVPAGWPLRVIVTFDLPQIVKEPEFTVYAPPGKGTFALPGPDASALNRASWGAPPPLRQRGQAFEIPNLAAVTPTRLTWSAASAAGRPALLLEATIKNLYGYDLNLPNDLHLTMQIVSAIDGSVPTPSQVGLFTAATWVDPSGQEDARPLAPGMERQGAFVLDVEGGAPASSLVMIMSQRGEWALYSLDDLAPRLVEQAIAPPDPYPGLVNDARSAAAEGNWVRATTLLQTASRLHPADEAVASELREAREKAGRLLFAYHDQLLARRLALGAGSAEVAAQGLEVREPCQISPDGRKAALFDGPSKVIVDLQNNFQVLREVDLGRFDYFGELAWSPTSDRVIVTAWGEGVMMLVDVGSGQVTRIPSCAQGGSIVWSPQGNRVAYRAGDDKVFVQNLDGSGCAEYPVPYQGITVHFALAWSPDGKKLYFPANGRLMSLALDQADPQPAEASSQAWPGDWGVSRIVAAPDGRHLALLIQYGGILIFDTQTGTFYSEEQSQYDYALVGWTR